MTDAERWAACGAMALTGDRAGPPLAPDTDAAARLDRDLAPFGLDAGVLAERAALVGLERRGRTSCGGATRLLPARDGWLAVALARPDDVGSLPALFEVGPDVGLGPFAGGADPPPPWAALARVLGRRSAEEVLARARLLGVPMSRVGEEVAPFAVRGTPRGRGGPAPGPRVVDLSALWAGPLAAGLLARAGAEVVKVEALARPDGARRGDPGFYALLNAGKRSVALDLAEPEGRARLRRLVEAADVVVTSARARAVEQLGLDPEGFLAGGDDRVWVAVTAYGWAEDRVGFGDDCGVAAGLVAWHPVDGEPRFVADAVADPLCGARAAAEAWRAWTSGGRWFVDASLAGAAAAVAGPGPTVAATRGGGDGTGWVLGPVPVAPPRGREASGAARPLGADTRAVLAEVG